jgi:nucleoside-diphosphate-sugar epimerase
MNHTVLIVGGAGYVGEMLCEQLGKRADVAQIIALDRLPQSDYSKSLPKVTYIEANMADDTWQEEVATYEPTIIVHTAWQIRAMYGEAGKQWNWNVHGSQNVFEFAFGTSSVTKLIYFSTAALYGAGPKNTFEHYFTELETLPEDEYIYAKEKRVAEQNLKSLFDEKKGTGSDVPQVFVVRPAAITGPRGRYMRIRFGLQSALAGNLERGFLNRVVTTLTSFFPATKGWVRQFIHEDDVTDIVSLFAFEPFSFDYQIFNITPTGEPVLAPEMAKVVGKRTLYIHPRLAQFAFSFFWHATRGKVPTAPGSWRFYCYPLLMSGDKLKMVYECKYSSKEAITYTTGRYEDWVPEEKRKIKIE